ATAYTGSVEVESEGVKTFVEDGTNPLEIKNITITELREDVLAKNDTITLKLNGNWEYVDTENDNDNDNDIVISFLNSSATAEVTSIDDDEIVITITAVDNNNVKLEDMTISGIQLKATKKCSAGDQATITVKSSAFSSVKLIVAKMVEEAVTYTVEDDDLPVIWAGKDYALDDDDTNTLEVYVEENTGDILNTSRKATFTFPDGIEVVSIDIDLDDVEADFKWEIDENVVTIWNYSSGTTESTDETDFGIKFLINAAPSYEGDVDVTLGGEFDDVEFTVATVQAPYIVEAKTSEVLIDYRYVPVNEIVITEAEEGILAEGDVIILGVEKMDFEDAGTYEVTEGDIEVDVSIDESPDFDEVDSGNYTYLLIEVTDESTEASTITISGLELYLDRTLPVGGYALKNIGAWDVKTDSIDVDDISKVEDYKDEVTACNILWQNSTSNSDIYDADEVTSTDATYTKSITVEADGMFKYSALTANDSYVEVVTAARD
ncbi:MAG: hypothetical protein LUE88_02500, partial [Clostridiales bacterium]|nr:hypothetical protein [Clostridiales bacterium]